MESCVMTMASVWSDTIWPVLMLVVGFGAVIFFHELGHFLACKMVGINVERFAIGFGPRLCGIRRGDTDYCINILPLGGYVKMLGQEDFKPLEEEQGAGDPRAFNNKSISARMFVVSAGVMMNVILAGVMFIAVSLVGMPFVAAVAGGVSPDSPAAKVELTWQGQSDAATMPAKTVGLEPGDEIMEIDGVDITRFNQIMVRAALANPDEKYDLTVRRKVNGTVMTGKGKIGVLSSPGSPGGKVFGIIVPSDTVLDKPRDVLVKPVLHKGDRVVAIGSEVIANYWDIESLEKKSDGSDVAVTVERNGKKVTETLRPEPGMKGKLLFLADGTALHVEKSEPVEGESKKFKLTLADGKTRKVSPDELKRQQLDVLGMIPRIRAIAIIDGSPADDAGMQPGDVIIGYADRGAPTLAGLHKLNAEFAGQNVSMTLLRDGKSLPAMTIRPRSSKSRGAMGITSGVEAKSTVVAGVRKGSLAEKAGLQAGDTIEQINGRDVKTWNDIVAARCEAVSGPVTIKYRRGSLTDTVTTDDVATAAVRPADYAFSIFAGELPFRKLQGPAIKRGPLGALRWGAGETFDMVVMTYATLRGLMTSTVSPKELHGPVGIMDVGIKAGSEGAIHLVYLLALISVSLAVINFLPIPVVDGGIAVFLIIEKIRGKPLSLKLMNMIQMVGIVLLLSVFVYVTYGDIVRIISRQ